MNATIVCPRQAENSEQSANSAHQSVMRTEDDGVSEGARSLPCCFHSDVGGGFGACDARGVTATLVMRAT